VSFDLANRLFDPAWTALVFAGVVRRSLLTGFSHATLFCVLPAFTCTADVSHNIAKVEEHFIGGEMKKLLVHRKVCVQSVVAVSCSTVLSAVQRCE
jgi:RNA-splicing ligase RtcB